MRCGAPAPRSALRPFRSRRRSPLPASYVASFRPAVVGVGRLCCANDVASRTFLSSVCSSVVRVAIDAIAPLGPVIFRPVGVIVSLPSIVVVSSTLRLRSCATNVCVCACRATTTMTTTISTNRILRQNHRMAACPYIFMSWFFFFFYFLLSTSL